jgi:gluconate 2-dehydrogenase alpha chain
METGDGGRLSKLHGLSAQGSSYPVRENYLDLDPTYKDRHGRRCCASPSIFPDNDIAMSHPFSDQMEKMTKPFNAKYAAVVAYQKGGMRCPTRARTIQAERSWAAIPRPAR